MGESAFPLARALAYHRDLLVKIDQQVAEGRAQVETTQSQLKDLRALRDRLLRRAESSGAAEAVLARAAALQQRIRDLWLQMLALKPLLDRHQDELESWLDRRRLAERDINSLEYVRDRPRRSAKARVR